MPHKLIIGVVALVLTGIFLFLNPFLALLIAVAGIAAIAFLP